MRLVQNFFPGLFFLLTFWCHRSMDMWCVWIHCFQIYRQHIYRFSLPELSYPLSHRKVNDRGQFKRQFSATFVGMELYHNPRCSTSRASLALLNEKGLLPEIHEYMKSVPTVEELRALVAMLGIPAFELIRQNEDLYKEKYKGKKMSDEKWIQLMAKHPILIQRPIFIHNGKAVIGRPPERVLELL